MPSQKFPITANNRIIAFILPKWNDIRSIVDIYYYSLATFETKLSNGLLIIPKSLLLTCVYTSVVLLLLWSRSS